MAHLWKGFLSCNSERSIYARVPEGTHRFGFSAILDPEKTSAGKRLAFSCMISALLKQSLTSFIAKGQRCGNIAADHIAWAWASVEHMISWRVHMRRSTIPFWW